MLNFYWIVTKNKTQFCLNELRRHFVELYTLEKSDGWNFEIIIWHFFIRIQRT